MQVANTTAANHLLNVGSLNIWLRTHQGSRSMRYAKDKSKEPMPDKASRACVVE